MTLKEWPEHQAQEVMRNLQFLADRATGKVPTGASFIRNFVHGHPEYKNDSKVSDKINYDLLKMMTTLNESDSEARHVLLGQYA